MRLFASVRLGFGQLKLLFYNTKEENVCNIKVLWSDRKCRNIWNCLPLCISISVRLSHRSVLIYPFAQLFGFSLAHRILPFRVLHFLLSFLALCSTCRSAFWPTTVLFPIVLYRLYNLSYQCVVRPGGHFILF